MIHMIQIMQIDEPSNEKRTDAIALTDFPVIRLQFFKLNRQI